MVGKKRFPINLNHFRNAYFHSINKSKILYKEQIQSQLVGLKLIPPLTITYTYFAPDKRLSDLGNVLTIQSKYFEDALVELGYLEDDNYTFIDQIVYKFGSIDRVDPRVEIDIRSSNVI
jgi:Holliday junction resolvase RusA-like endonuclease